MRTIVVAALLTGAVCGSAVAQVPHPQPWPAADVDSRLRVEGRGLDQLSNPVYQAARRAHPATNRDPLRHDWERTRGRRLAVRFENRYGAELAGHLYGPREQDAPLPALVVLPGGGGYVRDLESMIQQLAEHGYVVLAVEPQGAATDDGPPSDVRPDPRFCGPGGTWREPQEAGIVEPGECAGMDGPPVAPAGPVSRLLGPLNDTPVGLAGLAADFKVDAAAARDDVATGYERFRHRFVFAGIDAATWLRSAANPWRGLVDPDRLGIAGWSAGADGAVIAGNADRAGRFGAVVAWDSYGRPPAAMPLRTPTMLQQAEQAPTLSPWGPAPPDPELWVSSETRRRLAAAGVPNAVVALRGSNHPEWAYPTDAYANPGIGVSSKGHQVAVHMTVAWFDRFLKGAGASRLTAERFDDTADRTSVGTGTYDPGTGQNVPYRIAGERVDEHLSRLFASAVELHPDFAPGPELAVAGRPRVRRGVLATGWTARCPGPALGAPCRLRAVVRDPRGRALVVKRVAVAPFRTAPIRVRVGARGRASQVAVTLARGTGAPVTRSARVRAGAR